jgi:putative addiction module CopG family antidote
MTINVPPDVATFVNSQVASGVFRSPDEVLRAAVESLQRDAKRQEAEHAFRQSLVESAAEIERGEFQECDHAFDDVEVELFGKRLTDE